MESLTFVVTGCPAVISILHPDFWDFFVQPWVNPRLTGETWVEMLALNPKMYKKQVIF